MRDKKQMKQKTKQQAVNGKRLAAVFIAGMARLTALQGFYSRLRPFYGSFIRSR